MLHHTHDDNLGRLPGLIPHRRAFDLIGGGDECRVHHFDADVGDLAYGVFTLEGEHDADQVFNGLHLRADLKVTVAVQCSLLDRLRKECFPVVAVLAIGRTQIVLGHRDGLLGGEVLRVLTLEL